jgi:hypothetical protein
MPAWQVVVIVGYALEWALVALIVYYVYRRK